ncbi:MAG: AsmA family protein, partial [Robiginitomaculum sp.]|nr:AsmA family protein [Robiginitomaculum sp.]
MRKLLIGLGILAVLLVAAVLILPSLVPASVYKDKITQQVSATLGRDVEIAGDVKLSVFPSLTAKADLVKIANGDGFSNQAFATMDSLEAKVKLMPLLKKQVEITAFTLVNPIISLEKAKDGRVNWAFGDEKPKPAQQSQGPFKRDGRYADLQISLGTFSLENGSINYSDAQAGANYDVKAVNMKLSMPGLDKPMRAKGDMVVNDMPMDMELKLDTPKSFLSGEVAPVFVKLKSNLLTFSADGQFTPSKLITFDLDLNADIPSTSKLDAFLGQNNPYGALAETAKLKGNLVFDGVNMIGKGTQFSLKSAIITTEFSGDFKAGGVPSASGDLQINVANIQKLQDALGMAIPQLAAFSTVDISTNLSTDGKVTTGKNLSIDIKGDGITANYAGTATFDNALSLAGQFSANSPSIAALLPKLGMENTPGVNILGDLAVSGKVSGMVDALVLDNLDFKTKGGDLVAGYAGKIKLGRDLSFDGRFDASGASVPVIVKKLGIQ